MGRSATAANRSGLREELNGSRARRRRSVRGTVAKTAGVVHNTPPGKAGAGSAFADSRVLNVAERIRTMKARKLLYAVVDMGDLKDKKSISGKELT